jgi:hypothetical protein
MRMLSLVNTTNYKNRLHDMVRAFSDGNNAFRRKFSRSYSLSGREYRLRVHATGAARCGTAGAYYARSAFPGS